MTMQDWRGSTILRGSIVVYPVRQYSAMWMVEAWVVEVRPDTDELVVRRMSTSATAKRLSRNTQTTIGSNCATVVQ